MMTAFRAILFLICLVLTNKATGQLSLQNPTAGVYGSKSVGVDLSSLAGSNILYLKLDDASGTNTIDSSTNSVALGQVVNVAVWTNGTPALGDSGSLFFDGVNDYVLITNTDKISVTNQFTQAMWVQMDTTGQSSIYFYDMRDGTDTIDGFIFGFTANKFEFYSGRFSGTNPRTPMPGVVTDTSWHHYAVTYDATTLRIYYDGTERTNRAISFSLSNTTPVNQRFRVGTSSGAGNFLKGKINAVCRWRRALSASEITLLQSNQGPT